MKSKIVYIVAGLVLVFASAAATTAKPKPSFHAFIEEQDNGDYRLYIFGSNRSLVCEEKTITVISQGDALSPVVLECKH
jgi:hypothetical protein